jgi:phosphatidylinositol alpha-1,6-mannosyltransferase
MLVTRNFPPMVGGMEKLNVHLAAALAALGNLSIVAPTGSGGFSPPDTEVAEVALNPLWRFLAASCWRTVALAYRRRPRLILAGSGLMAPVAWLGARLVGGRAAVYLHGLDLVVDNRIYAAAWLPFIRRCDAAICNSGNTAALALARGVERSRLHVVNPGADVPAEFAHPIDFRARFEIGPGPMLLSVGRFTRRKGLAEFVENCMPGIAETHPDATLVVIGGEASDALNGGHRAEWPRVEAAARKHGVWSNIRLIGRCGESDLQAAYAAADCHVFPVIDVPGDVEGFGMVALEAAAHGLHTVAFAVGGVPDAVEEGRSGRLVAAGDYQAFLMALAPYLDRALPRGSRRDDARAFAVTKSWKVFESSLCSVLAEPAK